MMTPTNASSRLYLAPASTGKTEYVLATARSFSSSLTRKSVICVPTPIHVHSARRRLATMGGAIGVQVYTFDDLWATILNSAHMPYTEAVDTARFRLMQRLLAELAASGTLRHFHTIAHTQGLVEVMLDRVYELATAMVEPDALLAHWQASHAPGRLIDIGVIYAAWVRTLSERDWVDRAGVGRLTLERLRSGAKGARALFDAAFFDGFDFLTELQVQTIAALARLPGADVTITLTGDFRRAGEVMTPVETRFQTTRRRLEGALGIAAEALPVMRPPDALPPDLQALHDRFITPELMVPEPITAEREDVDSSSADAAPSMIALEATARTAEIRAALRWIKQTIVQDKVAPVECALVVRDLDPYRVAVQQIAREFGIPIAVQGGVPLREHALIEWIDSLLEALLPDGNGAPRLPRDLVVDLWRSSWQDAALVGAPEAAADLLETAAHNALLVSGLDGWRDALHLAAHPRVQRVDEDNDGQAMIDADAIARLAMAFEEWLSIVTPPAEARIVDYIDWLGNVLSRLVLDESLAVARAEVLGKEEFEDDPESHPALASNVEAETHCALDALKRMLDDSVWSAEALRPGLLSFEEFVHEYRAQLEGVLYVPKAPDDAVFVGTVVHARGLPFASVAMIGLAEGEFPRRISEDPYLRQADRIALQEVFPGVQGEPYGIEREYFEETLARAERTLLITRPLLAENGASSEPSPFWLDVVSLFDLPVRHESASGPAHVHDVASLDELMRFAASDTDSPERASAKEWLWLNTREEMQAVTLAEQIVRIRANGPPNQFDGNLQPGELLAAYFPADKEWSPTALEAWATCGLFFFAGRVLQLEAPARPEDGVARWQVGQVYHDVLAAWYDPRATHPGTPEALEEIIAHHIDVAPAKWGFLDTPAWRNEALAIAENLRKSIADLSESKQKVVAVEMRFRGESALLLHVGEVEVRISGTVDRIDRLPEGGYRVIDYKSGMGEYDTPRPLAEGKRLQLALYAMAVEQKHGAGSVDNALYYFVHKGERASWSLASFEGGKENAYAVTRDAVERAVSGIRNGNFVPVPPANGCPDYCPAAAWCWHYKPRARGR